MTEARVARLLADAYDLYDGLYERVLLPQPDERRHRETRARMAYIFDACESLLERIEQLYRRGHGDDSYVSLRLSFKALERHITGSRDGFSFV